MLHVLLVQVICGSPALRLVLVGLLDKNIEAFFFGLQYLNLLTQTFRTAFRVDS